MRRSSYVQRIPMMDSCSIRSGVSDAARERWLPTQAPSRRGPLFLVPNVGLNHDGLDMLAWDSEVAFAFVELLGSGEVQRPLLRLAGARLRLLVLAGGFDSEDGFAHPLLHRGEFVPAQSHGLHSASEVFALVYDDARFGGQLTADRLQVQPREVASPLPFDGPDGAPGRVDLLQLLAPLLRQRSGARLHWQALGLVGLHVNVALARSS